MEKQNESSAAARVEPMDKWTYVPVCVDEYVSHFNIVTVAGGLIYEGATSEKQVISLIDAHNASLPATPPPQGETNAERGDALLDFIRDNRLHVYHDSLHEMWIVQKPGQTVGNIAKNWSLRDALEHARCVQGSEVPTQQAPTDTRKIKEVKGLCKWTPSSTERETKSGASLSAATDKEERFS